METKKIILTRGIQGSGKITWAKEWAEEDPENRIRFNWDDMRNMFGKYWVPSREPINKMMMWAGINAAAYCSKPFNIIIDNMNLNPKGWKEVEDWITTYNTSLNSEETNTKYELEFKDFKTPLEVCIERDSKRENPIGAGIITSTYNRYKDFYENTTEN